MPLMTKTKSRIAATVLGISLTAFLPACLNDVEDGSDFIEPEDDRSNEAFQGLYDCSERSDNGYRQGSRFNISVVKVDNKPVEVDTANAYIALQNAARGAGVNVRIVSGFRTNSEQTHLYGCYTNCNCNSCNLAARPGYSNHQSGHALDLNSSDAGVSSWLNANGGRFGFRRTVTNEPWHWEWWGNDSDYTGPCGGEGAGGNVDQTSPGADDTGDSATPADCQALPSEGGVIDDGDSCFIPGGPAQYLRAVDGEGQDDDLVWTGTTDHGSAVNFAEWHVKVPARGRYVVEAYVDAALGNGSRQAGYAVVHDGRTDTIVVSQQSTGWKNLGAFTFAATGTQKIRVGDNTGEDGGLNRKLVFDAIRLTPQQCPRLEIVTDGGPLNVRRNPNTQQSPIGTVSDGDVVDRRSSVQGQTISGTTEWHQIQKGNLVGFVSGAFVRCTE